MVKSYELEDELDGQTNYGCELTAVSSNRDDDSVSTGSSRKEQAEEKTDEMVAKPGEKGDPFRGYRYAKQVSLVMVWVCLGLLAEIIGPTMPDLTERLCVNYEDISRTLLGKSIGSIIGSILGGFLNEIYYRHIDLMMSVSLFCMSVACFFLPWVDTLGFVFTMLMINGIGEGIVNTGGNALVMHLWGVNASPHLHTLHFGFGLGALLAPQIARPFLSPTADDDNITVCEEVNGTVIESESRIEIAYGIIGIFSCLFSFVVLGFYIRGPPRGFPVRVPTKSIRKLLSAASCSRGYTVFAIEILVLLFFYYIQTLGGEGAYGKFLFSFAVEAEVGFSKDEASYLQSAYWASYTFARLLGGPLAKFIPINYIIIGDITGSVVTSIVLAIWAPTVSTVLWVFTCFMGMFIALAYPNGMCWANLHLDMNSMTVMLLAVGGSVGGFIYQAVTGSLFEHVGPETLMYVMVVYALGLGAVYTIMQTVAYFHERHLPPAVCEDEVLEVEEKQPIEQ